MARQFWNDIQAGRLAGFLNLGLTLFVMVSVGFVLLIAVSRWVAVGTGMIATRNESPPTRPVP